MEEKEQTTTQSTVFVNKALTELFMVTPESFNQFLERDGTRFLRFYWDKAGEKLPQEQKADPFGLNYEVRRPRRFTTVYLIRLPRPRVPGESYYVALVYRPLRRVLFVSDTSTVFNLEAMEPESEKPRAALIQWTPRLQRIRLKSGVRPDLNAFYEEVLKELGE
jgi:hypothetical protein